MTWFSLQARRTYRIKSTEPCEPLNRDICLTNKLFTYVLAGLPQIMTSTRAQGRIANDLGDAAQIVEPK